MSLVKMEDVSLRLNSRSLFSNLNLSINSGDKIGVVGDNGSGKSSLLRTIAKNLNEHEGNIIHSRGMHCFYVEQGFPDAWKGVTAFRMLENTLSDPECDKWKVDYVFEFCGFPKKYRSLFFNQLSGGWKKILLICRAVLSEPDLLLLDEPTNHLDQIHIANLIRLLNDSNLSSTHVVVSHNRDFLDSVTSSTLILHDRKFSYFNFSFSRSRDIFLEKEQAIFSSRIETVNEIERLKKGAHFQRQLGVNNHSDKALQKAKRIEKRIKILEAVLPARKISRKKEIALDVEEFHARKILEIDNLKLYSTDGFLLLHIKHLVINRGDRVVISGANGSGKSTLLKAIIDNTDPGIKIGPSVKLGILDQELSLLPLDAEIVEFIATRFKLDQHQAVNKLASAGFSFLDTRKTVTQISQGERTRLALLVLRLTNPNFLILDEPTNHLDITSQEALEDEILRLNPAAIIVSHDTRFVKNTASRFFEIGGGLLKEFGS
ncbi:ABC-F family ATP-binding cassette domain-containing protein [Pseudomonas sp. NFX98]|uniref:ABC-F family ATP-binding cassette domain-containing protein n=1 Tax=Pseudomonas sp. NFX98 TaxID=3399122 RepID=UPI0039FD3121